MSEILAGEGGEVVARLPERPRGVDHERAAAAVRELLIAVGEDPDRPGLRDTPARVARAYAETFAGLWQDPSEILATRSEEHTSDIQSRQYLVCRLLLEKKHIK